MRIALGVLCADAGSALGRQPVNLNTRRRIGYMPEERGLYPKMKVAEQLIYLARLHGLTPAPRPRSVDDWLERLGVAARRDDEVLKLSLGNQQRVQLAAALVHDPYDPGAGRTVLRPRPGRGGRDEPGPREKCAAGVPSCSPATNSTSSSGCATGSASCAAATWWPRHHRRTALRRQRPTRRARPRRTARLGAAPARRHRGQLRRRPHRAGTGARRRRPDHPQGRPGHRPGARVRARPRRR